MEEGLSAALTEAAAMAAQGARVVLILWGAEYPLPSQLNNATAIKEAAVALAANEKAPLLDWLARVLGESE
jgi:hypothetical protein